MSDNTVTSYTPAEFSLTESAVEHFASNLDGHLYKGIRLSVSESTGCSGYTYQIDYVEKINKDDLVFNFDKISIFIDPDSFKFLKGTKVDFQLEGVNEGVKFLNPNVKAICGCGESFEINT